MRYTITAALPYANGPVHIGHLAGCYLPADVYARYLRLQQHDVLFIGGSDEHGFAITVKALKEGITPQELVDKYHAIISDSMARMGISYDIYSRTSLPIHHATAQEFFTVLSDNKVFTERESEQYYDIEANRFLADRTIIGECPNCGYTNAYGDQCENCGKSLDANDLINPKSALTGSTPVKRTTKHWYLPLQNYQAWLEEWLLSSEKLQNWKPNVMGQCKSWLQQGLRERSITRDLDWGVQVPLPDAEGKVLYVWMDAPIGYISATKDWAAANGKDWLPYWDKAGDSKLIHFIGKDNIVFHCIIFPAMLHAHGQFILPEQVPANEFLNIEGQKVSTSRNWAVWAHEYLEQFPDAVDALRYVLISIAPETKDSDFTWKDFQARVNNELADILGNLVNRLSILTQKHFAGNMPDPGTFTIADGLGTEPELAWIETTERIAACIEQFRIREALTEVMNLARILNKYLTDTEPWKRIKNTPEEAGSILYFGWQKVAQLSIIMEPFLPFTAQILQTALGLGDHTWSDAKRNNLIAVGQPIASIPILFKKFEDHTIDELIAKLKQNTTATMTDTASTPQNPATETPEAATAAVGKPEIQFDDFAKIELKTGTILEAERIPKADKLLKLLVDVGEAQPRTICSGIAEHYNPEDIIGQAVIVVANLAPRKMRGIESQGMLLMADDDNGKPIFAQPITPVPNGSEVR